MEHICLGVRERRKRELVLCSKFIGCKNGEWNQGEERKGEGYPYPFG
jgi:hypothetical protein